MQKLSAILIMLFMIVGCTHKTEDIYLNVKDGVILIQNIQNEQNGGMGTGFFIEENLIVTNYHVVENSNTLNIYIQNSNHIWEASLVSYSKDHDIALIKIKDWDNFISKEKWKTLEFADSSKVRVGETVYSLGHPWGLNWTFSQGIVSTTERVVPSSTANLFFQVDARIYQGNSGGPLLDSYGKVLGVNSKMIEGNGGSYGLSIPAHNVQKVIYDLKKYNESKVMKLGIMLGLSENKENIIIEEIIDDSSAEKCNLQKNDIILSIKTMVSGSYKKIQNKIDIVKQILILNMDQNNINIMIKRNNVVDEFTCEIKI